MSDTPEVENVLASYEFAKPVLVIEDKHGHSQTFTDFGQRVIRHQPRSLNTGATNDIARRIKDSEFAAIVT